MCFHFSFLLNFFIFFDWFIIYVNRRAMPLRSVAVCKPAADVFISLPRRTFLLTQLIREIHSIF